MPNSPDVDNARQTRPCLLRRRDQQLLACMAVIAGLTLLGWWQRSGGHSDRLIEWDRTTGHAAHFEVNVNRAYWPELTQLPEIGETLARRIVENRCAEGPFRAPGDLVRVHGIGEKTLDHMRPYLSPDSWFPESSSGAPFESSPPQCSEREGQGGRRLGRHKHSIPLRSVPDELGSGAGNSVPPLPDEPASAYNYAFRLSHSPPGG